MMDQEKFINAYVELLNKTVSEAIQKNIVLQTQKTMAEESVLVLQQTINKSKEDIKSLLAQKDGEINSLTNQLYEIRRQSSDVSNQKEELKKSIEHVGTFKSELVKARQEIKSIEISLMNKEKEIENLKAKLVQKEKEIINLKAPTSPKTTTKKKTPPLETNKEVQIVKDAGRF